MVSQGVRIGEAAHPGPPKLILRGVQANRFDVSAREAEDEVPSTVPATPGGVDAPLPAIDDISGSADVAFLEEPVCRVEPESPSCPTFGVGWRTVSWQACRFSAAVHWHTTVHPGYGRG